MVFLPTARQTGYLASLFNSIGIEVMEIHSRKSQAVRTKTSDQFRMCKQGIMFSSDVTARGMCLLLTAQSNPHSTPNHIRFAYCGFPVFLTCTVLATIA